MRRRHAGALVCAALALAALLGGCATAITPGAGPHAQLDAVAVLPTGEAWAVGEVGTILHYVGGRWSAVAGPTSADLYGVALASAGEGWAVGLDVAQGHGVILMLHHGHWTVVPGVTVPALRAVALVAPNEGWAAGGGGTLLHLTGGRWQAVHSPTTADLTGLAMLSASAGWATGYSLANTPSGSVYTSVAIHYSRGAWTLAGQAYDAQIYAVAATSQVAWLLGASAVGGGTIFFGSNGTFTPTGGDVDHELWGVALASPNDGWAVGWDGAIYHESFNRWEAAASPTTTDLYAVALASATEGWAVGNDGVILHLLNDTWTRYAG